MTTPAFAALLWLGTFPPLPVLVIGVVTAFAGYTAVYALNDVVGYHSDREKFLQGAFSDGGTDLDAVLVRHPMAQGYLSLAEGLAWSLGWGVVAFAGAWLLNPVCVLIFVVGCLLEAGYCLMWRVSPYRALVSGAVKTLGAVAAVFAVDPNPSPVFLAILFLCLFFWEIGGQNVPNDWADIAEDRRFGGQTIPICLGLDISREIILGSILLSLALVGTLFQLAQGSNAPLFGAVAVSAVTWLMLPKTLKLYFEGGHDQAMGLFNRASYFPPMLFALALVRVFFSGLA
ncbi:MAG: UbiA family prenyltransferase [Desulfobacterales bacterium]|nr:UbiA family prenyltransferase [Desulfobacterales bacterium]